ncbi:hypothetical protein BDK88_2940 [Natrinema hispanicum]|uniref:Major facilitator superfamily (MFS) profile domain-containing protein n=1 Tax=Natrinema hispanicum TaxID=392421 RepID=A0A482Y7K4_9EURY|nr:hypothetical protein [Natrinema hispanicum]RZV08863.1 hypothetical protein BDK88_2940 [Natrinema hispanicum]
MDTLSIAGLLGTLVVAALAAIGVFGFADGTLIAASGEYVTATIGVLVVAVVAVGALITLGVGSKRWRANPYW